MTHDHHIKEHEWQDGLCDCCGGGNCCMGTWCPCILVGKTADRLTGDESSSGCNAMCLIWTALTYSANLGCIVSISQRRAVREKYGIEGGCMRDVCTGFCCPCCAAIQEYTELEKRQAAAKHMNVDMNGYQAQPGAQAPMRM
ncbi:PLAC8 family-domain-containing protein [Diplogelasinospora grovesii]|uniref:PLAC8 family-domain-containing protein n=1 Tax=Diplogelasinospora grovesii TaxID=303347 RepID=A0AAN6S330_9PEZI|nr:PLAC8 family-domain-containing protein [Diplogelasinospora grovesii]